MLKTSDFDYDLPHELIAQTPLTHREKSRMMILNKKTGEVEHKIFENIVDYIKPGDCVVLNDTKVIPARLYGYRDGKQEVIEFLLVKQLKDDKWQALVKPGKKTKIGTHVIFQKDLLEADVVDILPEGERVIKFKYNGIFNEILDKLGTVPLPPYITEKLEDKSMYQTVYCKNPGSAAAPTAGLHFTKKILKDLENKGVHVVYVTLHVGIGTFRPVRVEDITKHNMHTEWFVISKDACDTINSARKNGNRIFCIGTTSCRVLESATKDDGIIYPMSCETGIFIYPGYKFKMVDALLTNFHLPKSTLIMLVSALAGRDNILNAYKIAVEQKYRFFSFGDCMLIM